MSGTDYRTVRKDDLERLLVKYRSEMDRYISAVKSGGNADTPATDIQKTLKELTNNNNATSEQIDTMIEEMRRNDTGYKENVYKTRHLEKILKEREDETSLNQYRLKQDIEADQWINRKIMFFRIVVIALIILLVVFLFRLKNLNNSSSESIPTPESPLE